MLDVLTDLSRSKLPELKDYGSDVSRWAKLEKASIYAYYISTTSFVVGLIGIFGLNNIEVSAPLLGTGFLGSVFAGYIRNKVANLEFKKDINKYVDDLSLVYARDKYFSKKNIGFFEKTLIDYEASLNKFITFIESHSLSENKINGLRDNYIELELLHNSFQEIIISIRANQKHNILRNSLDVKESTNTNLNYIFKNQSRLLKNMERKYSKIIN
jgi:hypothetical protein